MTEDYALKEAARARNSVGIAINHLGYALLWARRKGQCHSEIHGLISMAALVLEQLRQEDTAIRIRQDSAGESKLEAAISQPVAASPGAKWEMT